MRLADRGSSGGVSRVVACALAAAAAFAACRGEPEDAVVADALKILAYNIHHGEGMDSIIDLQRIAALIDSLDVDVVTLQEVDSMTVRTGLVDQTRELAAATGMFAAFGRFMDYDSGAYGMAVLSRWPMTEATNWLLPDGDEPRTALAARVTSPVSGREIVVVGIHFYGTSDERLAQLRELERHLAREVAPIVLAGDFNSTPGPGVMDELALRWTVAPKGADHFTFPSYRPDREIDFIASRPIGALEVKDQLLLDEAVISDHRPLVATIILK